MLACSLIIDVKVVPEVGPEHNQSKGLERLDVTITLSTESLENRKKKINLKRDLQRFLNNILNLFLDVTAIFVTTAIILNQTPIFRALWAIGLLLSFNIFIASKRTSITLFIKASKGAKGKAKPNSVIKPNCRTASKLKILSNNFCWRAIVVKFQDFYPFLNTRQTLNDVSTPPNDNPPSIDYMILPNTEVLDVQHPAYIRSLVAPKNHNYDHTGDTLGQSFYLSAHIVFLQSLDASLYGHMMNYSFPII
uniref:Uncharacterized protein n=1 Tax=Glossina austeni TaxID=7395 RepID=A0A1A9V6P6_GLOAU